jgi:hypothetical protein
LGLIALLFQGRIESWWEARKNAHDTRPVLATLESFSGEVSYRKPESLKVISARVGLGFRARDTILTDEKSTAIIQFKSGLKVEIQPQTIAVVEETGPELTFVQGHVKIIAQTNEINLPPEAIAKDEPPEQAMSQAESPLKVNPEEKVVNKHKKVDERESLPDSYIASVIRNQKTFLSHCYAQYLQVDPDTHGRIDTSITIEPTGVVSTARVIGSTIADRTLQQCVVSTLQRAKFKSFSGDPIIVTYPITFD